MKAFTTAQSLLLLLVTFVPFSLAVDCTADAFRAILPSNASVNFISQIQGPNGSFGDLNDADFPAIGYNLPDLCAVSINITTTNPSNTFSFGLYLPKEYNNRLIGTGNTGFGGGINWPYMGKLVHYGMATFSTDTGHNSNPSDANWAFGNDQALNNWGYLAMHESLVVAKQVIQSYYGEKIAYSYYMACSGGGRQGMKEMQEYPDDFNGYAIGAPPWLLSHLHSWATYVGVQNLPNDTAAHINETLLSNITDVVTTICDPQDGVADATIAEPWTCDFSSSELLCNATSGPVCLTAAQIPTFDKIFASWYDDKGGFIFPSGMLGADLSGLAGGDTPSAFGTQYLDNFVYNNTNWDPMTISPFTVAQADSLDAGSGNADNYDLTPFKNAGGKVLMYHGLADPLIPPGSTIYYYEQVQKTMASMNIEDFYKLFLIPGMHHCSGSYGAPYYIGGGGQKLDDGIYSVPGFVDPQHDIVLAVMAWVENGTSPDSLIATKFKDNLVANGVLKQAPLCPYPQRAIYQGKGPIASPDNWKCGNGTAIDYPTMTIAGKDTVSISPQPIAPTRPPGANAAGRTINLELTSLLAICLLSMGVAIW